MRFENCGNCVHLLNIGHILSIFYGAVRKGLKPVICEGRQFSVICHVKAILEGFTK